MFRENDHIGAEGSEFRSEAALGVYLEIEEGGGDCCSSTEGEQHHKEPAWVCAKQSSNDAPEHGPIGCATIGHHSPLRMGAGSYCEARCSGMALPRIVTPAASAMTTRKTINDGSGAAPKILPPTRRARTIPMA